MEKSLRLKIQDLIKEAEESLFKNEKVINLHEKGCKLPKFVEKVSDSGMEKTIMHLKNALSQLENTRYALKQLAFAAVSQDQIVKMNNEFSNCLTDFKDGNERNLNLSELISDEDDKENEWARVMLAVYSLSE